MLMLNFKINKLLVSVIFFSVLFIIMLIFTFVGKKNSNISPEQYLKILKYDFQYVSETEIIIPKNFNQTLKEYNKLQKEQGFDLSKHCGKKCIKKRFVVSSPKNKSKKYIADMIVFEDKLIGGDIHTQIYNEPPMKINSIS